MSHYTRGEKKRKSSATNRLLIMLTCVLLVAVIVLVTVFIVLPALKKNAAPAAGSSEWFDPSAQLGNLPGKTQEEIQAELDKIVEQGMFNISIASIVVFEHGDGEGAARIENIAANPYHMSVAITLDDTGETVYESKGIAPGQFIEYITLEKALAKGEYSATALFTAHNKDDLTKVGQAAAKITILVEN